MTYDLNKVFRVDYLDAVVSNMVASLGYVSNPDTLYDWFNMSLMNGDIGGWML